MRIVRINTTTTLIINFLIIQTAFRQFRLLTEIQKEVSEYVRIRNTHFKYLIYYYLDNFGHFFYSDSSIVIMNYKTMIYIDQFRQFRQFGQNDIYKPHRI